MGSLEDYVVLKAIGKGSYGEVHLIQHKKERKQYVVKKMALQRASKRERKAAELEAKLLSNLKHPNIVSYKDSFENEDGYLYIVMGYAEGGDLYTRLREQREKNEYLGEVQVVRWFIQICMALQYLHQKHILHRDLKTQNIFLTKTKMIKVGDLGIARVLEGASDMATTLIGTPYYMSPELFSNRPYNHKSDVWALGCCVYEMTTLKHAFNAKDMNSLVYKILKKKMPKMPELYSSDLCDLIKSMLHQNAGKRPSVNRILRHPFIKKHIQLFLDESSKSRRPTSGKSRRVASESSSRKTSSSSVQSRCSSRESNNSVFEQNSPQIILPPEQVNERKAKSNESRVTKPQCDPSPKPVPAKKEPVNVTAPSKPVAVKFVSDGMAELDLHNKEKPTDHHHKADVKLPSYDVECPVPSSKQPDVKSSKINRVTSAESATSSSSEGSTDKQNITPRPLPLLAKEERNESPHRVCDDSDSLKASGESNVSESSTRTRPSSARERRRREKQRRANQKEDFAKKPPPPQIIEPPVMANKENERNSIPVLDLQSKRKESAGEEINQFYTLLHTTLKLSNDEQSPPLTPPDNSGRSPSPLTDENRRVQLSPVQELSESAASTITSDRVKNQEASKNPTYTRNTPHATEIGVKIPAHAQPPTRGISQATLGSTGKLMDRIVALRKDCIHGLGVPLLHRAYELLDEDHDEEQLEKRLVKLLGEVRFKQWAGKIWQLKFCEESIFKHCGSITAY